MMTLSRAARRQEIKDRFRRMKKRDRIYILYLMAAAGVDDAMKKSRPELVDAHYLLFEALYDGQPERFFDDLAVTTSGGRGNIRAELEIEKRNSTLRSLAHSLRNRPGNSGLDDRAVAKLIIENFNNYRSTTWPRDRDNGISPSGRVSIERRIFHWILNSGLDLPKSANHLARIIQAPEPGSPPGHLSFTNDELRALSIQFSDLTS